jgi:hypothetical protein
MAETGAAECFQPIDRFFPPGHFQEQVALVGRDFQILRQ